MIPWVYRVYSKHLRSSDYYNRLRLLYKWIFSYQSCESFDIKIFYSVSVYISLTVPWQKKNAFYARKVLPGPISFDGISYSKRRISTSTFKIYPRCTFSSQNSLYAEAKNVLGYIWSMKSCTKGCYIIFTKSSQKNMSIWKGFNLWY